MKWLVDTSVWIDHFRFHNASLADRLRNDGVVMHSAIVGELACGNLPRRGETLINLALLPRVEEPDAETVLSYIETKHLFAHGLGWVDAQLLVSAVLAGAQLWTLDRKLARFAGR
jgi:predicted nucleic acid-binding protein